MKCMRLSKNRSTRPTSQLAISRRASIPRTANQQRKSSVRDILVWIVTITAQWYSCTTSQSTTTPMIALDLSGTTHHPDDHNVALIWFSINQQAQYDRAGGARSSQFVVSVLLSLSRCLCLAKKVSYLRSRDFDCGNCSSEIQGTDVSLWLHL
ncbi:hypothetical protein F511_23918 [Dorcoceras hygrometricum]|uniref:Uncharacterized protein n=1 Tax=Dorcoceras hygrometricum TaxID=472368 RepID=A0A2Z7BS65_9LAMI|nr:hypothetical protein F511_23918 [Dorcoceras hygrometricum]